MHRFPHTPFPHTLLADIAPLGLNPAWIVLVSAVLFVMYLTFRPKKRDPLASQPFRTSLVQQRALERDMQNVIVELSEMTRQMSAQLETRSMKLEQLIRDADAKIAELRQAEGEAVARHASPTADDGGPTPINSEAVAVEPQPNAAADDHIEPAPVQPARPAMRLVTDNAEDRWAEVYRLGDEGLTLPEIARRLSRPRGEVELILALRPKPASDATRSEPHASDNDIAAAQ